MFGVLQRILEFSDETASLFSLLFLMGNVMGYWLYVIIPRPTGRIAAAANSPLINAVLMALLLVYHGVDPAGVTAVVLIALMMGIASATLALMWATSIGETSWSDRGRYVGTMLLLASVIYSIIIIAANISNQFAYILMAVLMVGAWRLAVRSASGLDESEDEPDPPRVESTRSVDVFWVLFIFLLLGYYSLAWISHENVFSRAGETAAGLSPVVAAMTYGMAAFLAGTLADRTREIEGIAMVGLAALVSSFLLVPAAADRGLWGLLDAFLQGSYGVLDFFVLTYLALPALLFGGPVYRYYALGLSVNAMVVASGFVWGPPLEFPLHPADVHTISLVTAVALIIGTVSALVLRGFRTSWVRDDQEKDPVQAASGEQLQEVMESAGLTNREQDVVLLILQGHANQQIADELSITVNTVKTHIRNIYSKTGASSRADFILKISGPDVKL